MLRLVKNRIENGKKIKIMINILKDGSCLLFREDFLIKRYSNLEKCLYENKIYEFLKEDFNKEIS